MRRRADGPPGDALAALARMMREGTGLRLLLAQLPAGSTLADAHRLRRRMRQEGRRPCTFLDRELGIQRG